jgi:hypothetical protein
MTRVILGNTNKHQQTPTTMIAGRGEREPQAAAAQVQQLRDEL